MTELSRWRLDEKPGFERVLGSSFCDLARVPAVATSSEMAPTGQATAKVLRDAGGDDPTWEDRGYALAPESKSFKSKQFIDPLADGADDDPIASVEFGRAEGSVEPGSFCRLAIEGAPTFD